MNDLTLAKIKENLGGFSDKMAIDSYMLLLVEKHYKKVGNSYMTIEDYKIFQNYSFEDVDENGIGIADGFDYCMDEEELKENSNKKENWKKMMKENRVSLEKAFEILVEKGF